MNSELLNRLYLLDKNGWCTFTDGSMDEYSMEEQREILEETLKNLVDIE